MANDVYTSPLASRYASPYMLHLFSPDSRFQTWRRLWVALARAQHQLGLPITARQVQEMEAHVTDIDYEVATAREREVRHDVMAHVYAYGKAAPSAAGILHLQPQVTGAVVGHEIARHRLAGVGIDRVELRAEVGQQSGNDRLPSITPTIHVTPSGTLVNTRVLLSGPSVRWTCQPACSS